MRQELSFCLNFQNYAWELDKNKYNELKSFINSKADFIYMDSFQKSFPRYFNKFKKSKEWLKLLDETSSYRDQCEKEWTDNYQDFSAAMREITKLNINFGKNISIYITHPAVSNGSVWD